MNESEGQKMSFDKRTIPAGTFLFRQGDVATTAYLVQKGKIRVTRDVDGEKAELAVIEPGEIVGEMALLMDKRYSASAEVLEDANLIVLDRGMMGRKYITSDQIMKKIIFCLVNRLYKANVKSLKSSGKEKESV